MERPTSNNADEWALWFFEFAGHGAQYLGVQIAEAMDEHVARTALLDRMQETRFLLIDNDQAVCVGGRFDGWLMQRHPDGQWVTVKSLETERPRMVTIPASPL